MHYVTVRYCWVIYRCVVRQHPHSTQYHGNMLDDDVIVTCTRLDPFPDASTFNCDIIKHTNLIHILCRKVEL